MHIHAWKPGCRDMAGIIACMAELMDRPSEHVDKGLHTCGNPSAWALVGLAERGLWAGKGLTKSGSDLPLLS